MWHDSDKYFFKTSAERAPEEFKKLFKIIQNPFFTQKG